MSLIKLSDEYFSIVNSYHLSDIKTISDNICRSLMLHDFVNTEEALQGLLENTSLEFEDFVSLLDKMDSEDDVEYIEESTIHFITELIGMLALRKYKAAIK